MLCEKCKIKPATVYLSQNINGKKTELNVCASCAAKLGYFGLKQPFSFDLFGLGLPNAVKSNECPGCGETYEEYRESGLLGCEKCYSHFSLGDRLAKIHGKNIHTGKLPEKANAKIKRKRNIEKLKKELKEAIFDEKFEDAAKLRDLIKEAEGEE